jgi:hypothetical protein
MSEEARRLVALEHLAKMSASVEVQLHSPEWEPIKAILARAREWPRDAMVALPRSTRRTPDRDPPCRTRRTATKALSAGSARSCPRASSPISKLSDAHAEEMRELILQTDPETRTALGLPETGAPTE